jgi:putative membrane protein
VATIQSKTGHRFRRVALATLSAAFALFPGVALAHSGPPPTPDTLWRSWTFEPVTLLVLGVALWAYIRGIRRLWPRIGRNRSVHLGRIAAAFGGFLALGVALISPLDALSSALFSAHMTQHMLLITAAPLLFVLAGMGSASVWALPASWRQSLPGLWRASGRLGAIWRGLVHPVSALLLHSLVPWIWHVPFMYNAAIRHEFIHGLEHISMFATALLFWHAAIQRGRRASLNYGVGVLLVFALVLQKTALGALITFSSVAWYASYETTTAAWGLTPLEDQQLAGAVLLGPTGMIYLAAGVLLFAGWWRAIERRVAQDEQLSWDNREHAKETA